MNNFDLNADQILKFSSYNLEQYIYDIQELGLESTWGLICAYILNNGENENFLNISNFGEMYEIGLAIRDKTQKKKSGQYYTPDDVAQVMAKWLEKCDGDNVCDVACGTGKLILTYLDLIGPQRAYELINSGRLYLYDFDYTALKICKTAIIKKYNIDDYSCIHDVYCDFLNKTIKLPQNSKVISNPPYASVEYIEDYWEQTDVVITTKELYSSFMEKIFKQAKSTVIITPFSFISGNKFHSLRKKMCEIGNGFIVSFDNVPGNIFCGRKHGIFNTNTSNSVRAAITVLQQDDRIKGFKVSPLIRFKNEERKDLLSTDVLESTLPDELQVIDENNQTFEKVDRNLNDVFKVWKEKSKFLLRDVITKSTTSYFINMPNTCRYYTTASHRKLNRKGSIMLNIENKDIFNFVYCLINSSFAYWWWRIYDGGITYPLGILHSMPIPFNLLNKEDKTFFEGICNELINVEDNYIITKMNAGEVQENIKFPEEYRKMINERVLSILGFKSNKNIFDSVHTNRFFNKMK